MRIKINHVETSSNGDVIVSFSTQFGRAQARWASEQLPDLAEYDVELEVNDELVWGDSITLSPSKDVGIEMEEDKVLIRGVLERVDASGVADLRLGPAVLSVETSGKPADADAVVQLICEDLELFDSNT